MYNYKNSRGNLLYDTLNYVYYLLGVNICFILSNILFIIALSIIKLEFQNTLIFIISLIPTGPSITALFSVIGKFIREGDISPFKDYFKSYKLNFKQSMKIWVIQLLIIVVMVIDIRYMIISKNFVLLALFKPLLFIGGIIFSISIYLYAILSRFELKTKDLIKLSVIYTFKKLPLSIINILLVLGLVYFGGVKLPIFIPLIAGIIAYLLMLGQTSTLKEIEKYIISA
ncbi:MAG: YesL family protein [Romboutsia sp.]|uniref:YesL family protein n=1 Tax=Romboutsia sp. TaxID=1965302 RepID=UPI003F3CCD3D